MIHACTYYVLQHCIYKSLCDTIIRSGVRLKVINLSVLLFSVRDILSQVLTHLQNITSYLKGTTLFEGSYIHNTSFILDTVLNDFL